MAVPATSELHTLTLQDLTVGYGELVVARNLNLSVEAGNVLLLLGPNGAGKTTTLMTVAGSLPPLAGKVRWAGQILSGPIHRRARNGMGVVLDERGSIQRLTAAENLRLAGGSVERAIEIFPELEAHLKRRVGLLSGGQQKMLCLAVALSRPTSVLLADELSLGLAPQIVTRLLGVVRAAADAGAAVVIVEQHARQALEIADSVAVLMSGAFEISGAVADVRPAVEGLLRQGYLRQTAIEPSEVKR